MSGRALGTAAALFYIFLWASAYVPSKIGVLDSSPLWFLAVRFAVSGTIALVIARTLGAPLPHTRRDWLVVAVLGVLGNALYLGLTYEALRHLASGVASIVASLNPLLLALVAPWALREPLTLRKDRRDGARVRRRGRDRRRSRRQRKRRAGRRRAGVRRRRRERRLDDRVQEVVRRPRPARGDRPAIAGGGIFVLPLAILTEGAPHAHWTWQFVTSFVYVVLVMSVGASLLWFWLLTHGEASRVSAFYFLTPVFGLAIAAVLLHEPVGVHDLFGLAAIAAGITPGAAPVSTRWRVLALMTGAQAGASVVQQALGSLAPVLVATFALSKAQLGVVFTAIMLGSTAFTALAGALTDRWGERTMLLGAGALMARGIARRRRVRLVSVAGRVHGRVRRGLRRFDAGRRTRDPDVVRSRPRLRDGNPASRRPAGRDDRRAHAAAARATAGRLPHRIRRLGGARRGSDRARVGVVRRRAARERRGRAAADARSAARDARARARSAADRA